MKKVDVELMLVAMHEGKLPEVRLNADGAEVLDSTPMAPPLGYKKSPSMVEIMRDVIRSERLAVEALASGLETFEEADDFDVGEDFDPTSPYEDDFDPPVRELRRRYEEELREKEEGDKDASSVKEDANAESEPAEGVSRASVGSGGRKSKKKSVESVGKSDDGGTD